MKTKISCLLISLLLYVTPSVAHEHEENEIGIANSFVYMPDEDTNAYGLHAHYIRSVFEHFGLGLGYERIFDDHGHQTFGAVFQYHPIHPLSFNVSPGILVEENSWATRKFSLHTEASWEFEVGPIHLGPLVEVAWGPDDLHFSAGLHTGIPF